MKGSDAVFRRQLAERIGQDIIASHRLGVGAVTAVSYLETKSKRFVLKSAKGQHGKNIIRCEYEGLSLIKQTQTIAVPEIHLSDSINETHFILMDYIESKRPSKSDYQKLALHLASLHNHSSKVSGMVNDNYIGTLYQSNKAHNNWIDFYLHERLKKQMELAVANNYYKEDEIPESQLMRSRLSEFLQDIQPALLHGDLWGGNFLISIDGTPYLIDPSPYYGHHEIDIAMSKLFGGFSEAFYLAYHDVRPFDEQTNDRIKIYQLYYLLVHLNMFGRSYLNQVEALIQRYFR